MGPEEITRHSRESLFTAQRVTKRVIIVLMDDTNGQVHIVGNHITRGVELIDAVLDQVYVQSISLDVIALCPR